MEADYKRAFRPPRLIFRKVPRHPPPHPNHRPIQQARKNRARRHKRQNPDRIGDANLPRVPKGRGHLPGREAPIRHHGHPGEELRRRLLRVPHKNQGAGAPPGLRDHPELRRLRHHLRALQSPRELRGPAEPPHHPGRAREEAHRAARHVQIRPQNRAIHLPGGEDPGRQVRRALADLLQHAADQWRALVVQVAARPHQRAAGQALAAGAGHHRQGGVQGRAKAQPLDHEVDLRVRGAEEARLGEGGRRRERGEAQPGAAHQGRQRAAPREFRPGAHQAAPRGEVLQAARFGHPADRRGHLHQGRDLQGADRAAGADRAELQLHHHVLAAGRGAADQAENRADGPDHAAGHRGAQVEVPGHQFVHQFGEDPGRRAARDRDEDEDRDQLDKAVLEQLQQGRDREKEQADEPGRLRVVLGGQAAGEAKSGQGQRLADPQTGQGGVRLDQGDKNRAVVEKLLGLREQFGDRRDFQRDFNRVDAFE